MAGDVCCCTPSIALADALLQTPAPLQVLELVLLARAGWAPGALVPKRRRAGVEHRASLYCRNKSEGNRGMTPHLSEQRGETFYFFNLYFFSRPLSRRCRCACSSRVARATTAEKRAIQLCESALAPAVRRQARLRLLPFLPQRRLFLLAAKKKNCYLHSAPPANAAASSSNAASVATPFRQLPPRRPRRHPFACSRS